MDSNSSPADVIQSQLAPATVKSPVALSLSSSSDNTSNCTPSKRSPSSEGYNSNSQEMCTPKNRILNALKSSQETQGSQSPVLQIPATPVMERLGYGTGVGVFLLERSPRLNSQKLSPWAIKKTVKVAEDNEVFSARIEYEASILKKLSHPNIIGYRAFGMAAPDKAFLAMERASKSLGDLIEDRVNELLSSETCDPDPEAPFPANNMEKVALDTSKALMYLHEEVKLVHGDLKSANVLVFGDFETIKLCDFGVSRKLSADGTVEGNYVGTEIWNPMEVIQKKRGKNPEPITYKADMYSFGLVIYEMITLKPPHLSNAEDSYIENASTDDVSTEDTIEISFDEDAYERALERRVGTRPAIPDIEFDNTYNTILGIFFCCTDEDPTKRPDAKVIIDALTLSK